MPAIHDYMSKHHEHCDGIFTRAKEAAADGDWAATERYCKVFLAEINRHIDAEENLLFPAFEDRTGMTGGPTQVMRMEHAELRELFAALLAAIDSKDSSKYTQTADRVAGILGEHNMKEENILYPMLDDLLGGDGARMLVEVKAVME